MALLMESLSVGVGVADVIEVASNIGESIGAKEISL